MTSTPGELPPATVLRWHGLTDRGRVRKNNEDSFLALRFDAREVQYLGKTGEASLQHTDFAFAVSDGMGGANAGEFASRVAVDKITRLLPKSYKQAAKGMSAGFGDVLEEIIDQIHKALLFLGQDEDTQGMGATLTLCWFTPGWLYFAHVGDTRLYYLPAAGGLQQATHDDTHVGWLFRQGKLTEYGARTHPRRNSLQKALGAGHQIVEPQIGSIAYGAGDRFLLCTDGVTDGLYDSRVLDLLRPMGGEPPDANPASLVVREAIAASGRDNTTALVIDAVCAKAIDHV